MPADHVSCCNSLAVAVYHLHIICCRQTVTVHVCNIQSASACWWSPYAIEPLSVCLSSVCPACEQIGCRTITSTILNRFSPNFACSSEMWSLRRLLFKRQTGSSLPILEVCRLRFRQFLGFGDPIFQQITTKCHVQIKFNNADFVFNGEWNRK